MPNPEGSINTGNNSSEILHTRPTSRVNFSSLERIGSGYLDATSSRATGLEENPHQSRSIRRGNTPDFNNLGLRAGNFYGPGPEDYYRFPENSAQPSPELPRPEAETDLQRISWEFSQDAINYVQSLHDLDGETEAYPSLEDISRPNTYSDLGGETLFDESNAPSDIRSSTLWIRRRGSESSFDSVSQASWGSSEPNSSNSIASEQDN